MSNSKRVPRPAYIVIIEKLKSLNQEIEPVLGSFADAGVIESFLGITNNIPVKAELLISVLAEIDMTKEECEIASTELQQVFTQLTDKIKAERNKLGSESNIESQEAEANIRIYEDHFDRLLGLCKQYDLLNENE